MRKIVIAIALCLIATSCSTTEDAMSDASGAQQTPPRIRSVSEASYPSDYAGPRGEQTVIVEVTVDPAGAITDASIHQSPDPQLNPAALEAARKFKIEPRKLNGKPVETLMRVPVTFR